MSQPSPPKENANRTKTKWYQLNPHTVLLILMVISVCLGIIFGAILKIGGRQYTAREVMYIGFIGDLFMSMLKMLILPLIISSLINSLSQLNPRTAGRLGSVTVTFFLVTTFVAVLEGITLVLIIGPGYYAQNSDELVFVSDCVTKPVDTILDLFRNLIPTNLLQSCLQSVRTCATIQNTTTYVNGINVTSVIESINIQYVDGINILGLVFAALAYGIIISSMGDKTKALGDFFNALEAATMRLVAIAIWFSPLGIIFLIAKEIVQMSHPARQLESLAMYILTVILGLIIHSMIILPLIYLVIVRRNPFRHMAGVAQALMTALGTSSGSATLPVTIRCMEENNKCDPRVSRFVLPLSATVNMNGTALYEAVAAIYISQVKHVPLGIGQVVIVSITATLAAIGAAGIPQAGLVTLIMVLTAVGLPPEYAALIIPVDWFLDRIRTMANVFGDTVGAAVVHTTCTDYLSQLPSTHMENDDENDKSYKM